MLVFHADSHPKPLAPPPDVDSSLAYNINNIRNYSLAVSGEVFRWIVDFAPPIVLQRVSSTCHQGFVMPPAYSCRCLFAAEFLRVCPPTKSTN